MIKSSQLTLTFAFRHALKPRTYLRLRIGDKVMFGLKTCILSDEAQIRTIKTKTETGTEIETETDTDTETKSGAKRVITLITDDVESQKKVPVVVQLQLCETRRGTPITPLKFSSTEISAVLDISDTFVSFLRKAWRVDKKLYALQDVVVEYERNAEYERYAKRKTTSIDKPMFRTRVWDYVHKQWPIPTIFCTVWINAKRNKNVVLFPPMT